MAKRDRFGSDPLDDLILTKASPKKPSTVNRKPSTADTKRGEPAVNTKGTEPTTKGTESTTKGIESTTKGTESTSDGVANSNEWEANNVRVTFYCPTPLLEEIEKEIGRSGRSKTRVIVDALRSNLLSK